MKKKRALARLGILAVGLGIGGAVGSVPAIATADSSFDWLSAVDSFLSGGALSAADTTPALNLAISFDGMSLFQDGTAYAYSGDGGNIAIANGAGATAYAFGTNNYASVDGTNSTAVAGGMTDAQAGSSADNTAFVFGDASHGWAGTTDAANPGSFNYAVIFGDNNAAWAGGSAAGAGSYDGAYVEGNNVGTAYAQGADYLANILKFYGDGANSTTSAAAAESTNLLSGSDSSAVLAEGQAFWTDLFSGDTQGALTAGTNFWTDLLGGTDVTGAATDTTNWWTDLLGGSTALADTTNLWTDLVSAFDGGGTAADLSNFWTDLAGLF